MTHPQPPPPLLRGIAMLVGAAGVICGVWGIGVALLATDDSRDSSVATYLLAGVIIFGLGVVLALNAGMLLRPRVRSRVLSTAMAVVMGLAACAGLVLSVRNHSGWSSYLLVAAFALASTGNALRLRDGT